MLHYVLSGQYVAASATIAKQQEWSRKKEERQQKQQNRPAQAWLVW
jgi:hypothetical protein